MPKEHKVCLRSFLYHQLNEPGLHLMEIGIGVHLLQRGCSFSGFLKVYFGTAGFID